MPDSHTENRVKRWRGNIRPAPFFLSPATVGALVDLAAPKPAKLVEVPVLPIKLVDRPRRSEDPRLARANDDSLSVPDRVAPQPETSAPVAQQAVEQAALPDWPDAPLPDEPEWTGYDSGFDPVADPDLDRPESAPPELRATAPADPAARLALIAAAVRKLKQQPATPVDWDKAVAARRRMPLGQPKRATTPLQAAPTREACPKCGVPGSKGCAHFLPCEDGPVAPPPLSDNGNTLRRHANHKSSFFRRSARECRDADA